MTLRKKQHHPDRCSRKRIETVAGKRRDGSVSVRFNCKEQFP